MEDTIIDHNPPNNEVGITNNNHNNTLSSPKSLLNEDGKIQKEDDNSSPSLVTRLDRYGFIVVDSDKPS